MDPVVFCKAPSWGHTVGRYMYSPMESRRKKNICGVVLVRGWW